MGNFTEGPTFFLDLLLDIIKCFPIFQYAAASIFIYVVPQGAFLASFPYCEKIKVGL
jgi:hypothetical protein